MRYGDLSPGDMFGTILGRYVKQEDGSVMEVGGPRAGQIATLSDDFEVVPLFVAKERTSLREIVDEADELSAALWADERLPEPKIVRPRLERLDSLIQAARRQLPDATRIGREASSGISPIGELAMMPVTVVFMPCDGSTTNSVVEQIRHDMISGASVTSFSVGDVVIEPGLIVRELAEIDATDVSNELATLIERARKYVSQCDDSENQYA